MISNIYTALYSYCCQVNSVILELIKYREMWAIESDGMMWFLFASRLVSCLISGYWSLGWQVRQHEEIGPWFTKNSSRDWHKQEISDMALDIFGYFSLPVAKTQSSPFCFQCWASNTGLELNFQSCRVSGQENYTVTVTWLTVSSTYNTSLFPTVELE